jgi:hypothetical protein
MSGRGSLGGVGDDAAAVQLQGGELAEERGAGGDRRGVAARRVGNAVGDVAGQRVELGVGQDLHGEPVAGGGRGAADVDAAREAVGDFVVRMHRFGVLSFRFVSFKDRNLRLLRYLLFNND